MYVGLVTDREGQGHIEELSTASSSESLVSPLSVASTQSLRLGEPEDPRLAAVGHGRRRGGGDAGRVGRKCQHSPVSRLRHAGGPRATTRARFGRRDLLKRLV